MGLEGLPKGRRKCRIVYTGYVDFTGALMSAILFVQSCLAYECSYSTQVIFLIL